MSESASPAKPDFLSSPAGFMLAWGLPILAMVAGGFFGAPDLAVKPPALAWMGVACLLNARRCGRLHCYITGPFFLLLAALGLAHGFAVLPLGTVEEGWRAIGAVAIVGGLALWLGPELLWGKYRRRG